MWNFPEAFDQGTPFWGPAYRVWVTGIHVNNCLMRCQSPRHSSVFWGPLVSEPHGSHMGSLESVHLKRHKPSALRTVCAEKRKQDEKAMEEHDCVREGQPSGGERRGQGQGQGQEGEGRACRRSGQGRPGSGSGGVRAGPAGGWVRGTLRKLFSLREGEPAGPGEWSSSRSQGCT